MKIKNFQHFRKRSSLKLSDFDYNLPKSLIAQKPVSPRDNSRLMVVSEKISHKHFYNILDYLHKGDVLVINETKVNPARLIGFKETGAKVEFLITQTSGDIAKGHIKCVNPLVGINLVFGKYKAEIIDKEKDVFILKFSSDAEKIMNKIGEMPVPPYVTQKLEKNSQYQTIYSSKKGSVAAPTAGLHFTKGLINKIKKKGVKIAKITLHVGLGTFLPVRDLREHKMHSEYFEVDSHNASLINNRKGKLFVVGTTSVRALESVSKNNKVFSKKGSTDIFIKPGYNFNIHIDGMITNFHLPKSTLLMLVSAFLSKNKVFKVYSEAIKKKYRFYSFGDAMLLLK